MALMAGNDELHFGQMPEVEATPGLLAYAPASDTWRTANMTGSLSTRVRESLVWTGTEVLVWGGMSTLTFNGSSSAGGDALDDGASYDPATDTWNPLPLTAETPSPRAYAASVWTGSELLIWGGAAPTAPNGLGADPIALADGGARFHRL